MATQSIVVMVKIRFNAPSFLFAVFYQSHDVPGNCKSLSVSPISIVNYAGYIGADK